MEINKNTFEIIIDTSTPNSLIALLKDNQILAKCEWESNNNESKTLLPNINHLIKKNNLNIQSCSKIFVVIGPGGFSSLRIGVSTAKGLSIILGIPLIPIPTLLSSAMEFITENNKVYYSKDFVIKDDYPPYQILDFERLDNLNRELKDMNKKYHYIIVATDDQKDQVTIHGFLLIAFFIFTQWINWRYRFLISEKLYK